MRQKFINLNFCSKRAEPMNKELSELTKLGKTRILLKQSNKKKSLFKKLQFDSIVHSIIFFGNIE